MDAHNIGAAEHRRHRGGQTSFEPLVRLETENLADKGLARDADQQRLPEGGEHRQAAQQLQIVLDGFAETDTGIENDRLGIDPGIHGVVEPRGEKVPHLAHDIVIVRLGSAWFAACPACASKSPAPFPLATSDTIAGSKRRALMSLTMSAPASRAARATAAL